jgi:hypothetical protein
MAVAAAKRPLLGDINIRRHPKGAVIRPLPRIIVAIQANRGSEEPQLGPDAIQRE